MNNPLHNQPITSPTQPNAAIKNLSKDLKKPTVPWYICCGNLTKIHRIISTKPRPTSVHVKFFILLSILTTSEWNAETIESKNSEIVFKATFIVFIIRLLRSSNALGSFTKMILYSHFMRDSAHRPENLTTLQTFSGNFFRLFQMDLETRWVKWINFVPSWLRFLCSHLVQSMDGLMMRW